MLKYINKNGEYTLDGVIVREKFVPGEGRLSGGECVIYYFPEKSTCTNSDGEDVILPRMAGGDRIVLSFGEKDERDGIVTEADYCNADSHLAHVRIKAEF